MMAVAAAAANAAPISPIDPASARSASAPASRADDAPASVRGFWVQLGAFRERDGAQNFRQRVSVDLDWLSPVLALFGEDALFRLQAGPYPSRDAARLVAERVRQDLQLVPIIVERR
jgi:rare lipoprotein A